MQRPRLALAVRHIHFEHCGTLHDVLHQRGITVRYVEAGQDSLRDIDLEAIDLIVGLGGPVAVYDASHYLWINDELRLFERCVGRQIPAIGICLGAQMLAQVLGARVYPGSCRELGWEPLLLTPAGRASPVAALAAHGTSMLHWHGDTFDLPPQAQLLASTAAVSQQIFSWGTRVIGFQCHPEIKAAEFEAWLIGHAFEIAAAGVRVQDLRRDTALNAPVLARQAARVFTEWLAGVGL